MDEPERCGSPATGGGGGERRRAVADGGTGGRAPRAAAVGDDPAAFREQAREFAGRHDGLDFSPASLARLDELVADENEPEWARIELDDGRETTVAPLATAAACYFAAVLVRAYGAEWVADEDYRWALSIEPADGGEVRLNAFGIAHEGLTDVPRFAVTHDALVVELGLDGETVADPQAEAAAAGEVADVEELQAAAAADPEVAMAAAAAGIDAEEVIAGFREDAADLVDAWPSYDLDYSPTSLERLDALVGMELATDALADATFGSTADERDLLFTVRVMQVAGYLGEVCCRHADATWDTEDGPAVVVEGPDGTAEVEPIRVAAEAMRDETSTAAVYGDVVSRLGITDAGVDIDPDEPEFAPGDAPDRADVDATLADDGVASGGDGVAVDVDVTPDDVEVDLDADDLDVDMAPDAGDEDEHGDED
jgi:hypothetical protein